MSRPFVPLWERYRVQGDCWIWTGPFRDGVPQHSVNGQTRRAHRVSFEEARGPIPTGLLVRQVCGDPSCINPEHLALDDPGKKPQPILERFWGSIEKSEGCWFWLGTLNAGGYGQFWMGRGNVPSHRFAYELSFGPVPPSMQLDHVCHSEDLSCVGGNDCWHRRCVNPAHLEPVTPRENSLRGRSIVAVNATKTHCIRGHSFAEHGRVRASDGGRECLVCRREIYGRYRANKRLQRLAQQAVSQ